LGTRSEIQHRLGNGQLALRAAQAFEGVPGVERQLQRPRVGVADVLAGHAHHAAPGISGSQPPSSMRHSQYSAASGSLPRTALCSAEIWS
jgi:hypothetical protein